MHFHDSLVAKLVETLTTHGGFKDESRLKTVLRDMKIEAVRQPDGSIRLVYAGDVARGPR